jgi:hypothetical protein
MTQFFDARLGSLSATVEAATAATWRRRELST